MTPLNLRCRIATILYFKMAETVHVADHVTGACPGCLKGGPISLGFLKKGHQILKGGRVQWSDRGVQDISLPGTTNLAYLDTKE